MKKNLLSEELKKFQRLAEYDFYVPENYHDEEANLTEEDPEGEAQVDGEEIEGGVDPEMDAPADDMGQEPMGDDSMPADDTNDLSGDVPAEEPMGNDMGGEMPAEDPMAMPAEDEVELDVTQLVQGTEEAKASADRASQQIDQLMGKFDELSQRLNHMSTISNKIEDLEREVEKRLPTDKEKLEMRSLDSYPYSQKLSDYWFDKEGQYDVMGNEEGNKKPEEYVLTPDKINADYNDRAVADSLYNADEDYEEEDVY